MNDLAPFIGYLTLIERTADLRHFVRLMGENTVRQSHRDLNGCYVEDSYNGDHLALVLAPYLLAAERNAVVHEARRSRSADQRLMDRVILPLYEKGALSGFLVGLWADADAYPRRPLISREKDRDSSRLFDTSEGSFRVTTTYWALPNLHNQGAPPNSDEASRSAA